jgi:sugar diacid utilization regulator
VGKKSFAAVSAVVMMFAMLALPIAQAAEEVTRESYKEAVEPICKTNTQANERILKGVRGKVRAGKLKAAASQFAKASRALKQAIKQLKAVPQPTADEARLAKWLKAVEEEATLFQRTADKLNAGDENGAQAMVIRLTHNANKANNQVLPFEFKYCRFEPSKFT